MGWYSYYDLLKKHRGDLTLATKEELDFCARDNPIDSPSALELAREKYRVSPNPRT